MTDPKSASEGANVGAEDPQRRTLALALLGALGGVALFDGCAGPGADETAPGTPGSPATSQIPQELIGTSAIKWVDTILTDLKALTGQGISAATTSTVVALGRTARGDGGGGVFVWIKATPLPADDGGVIILPNTQPSGSNGPGYWKRLYSYGSVDVRWFGAVGDGVAADGPAIQKAIDFASSSVGSPVVPQYSRGIDVVFPPGVYKISAPANDAALYIGSSNVNLVGGGGPPYGPQILVDGPGTGILIESGGGNSVFGCGTTGTLYPAVAAARGTTIRGLTIYGVNSPTDGIVVHIPNFNIVDCFISGMSRHGILIESGCAIPNGLYGVSRAVSASGGPYNFNSNLWRVTNVSFTFCGNPASSGDEMQGAALFVHGTDSGGGVATSLHTQNSNVAFFDGSLGGATWVACYAEANKVGFKNSAVASSAYVNCTSEDATPAIFTYSGAVAVGGSMAVMGPSGAPHRIGSDASRLRFGTIHNDGARYGANIPGDPNYHGAIDISRGYQKRANSTAYVVGDRVVPATANGHFYKCTTAGTAGASPPAFPTAQGATVPDGTVVWTEEGTTLGHSQWTFGYEPWPAAPLWPYHEKSWRWMHLLDGILDVVHTDVYNGPFGWTSFDHPRGGGLPMIGNPLMNTQRRWTWRQSKDLQGINIVLSPGPNVIYIAGVAGGTVPAAGGAATFGDNPNAVWPKAETRVSVEIEFADVTALSGADLRVVGYTFIPVNATQRNIAVKIINSGSAAVQVTLVWHFETFVPNWDGGLA